MSRRCNSIFASLFIFGAILFAACAPTSTAVPALTAPAPRELTVFAAASLTDAFQEIGKQFEANHPGVKVAFNFGASNALRTQLEQGGRADVFASANKTEVENARKAGLTDSGGKIFTNNRLVVIVPSDNPGNVETLQDLAKPGLKFVMAEKGVPVGTYTLQMLDKMSADSEYGAEFGPTVLKNVVSQEQNVKAVVAKIALGEADAGVAYVSDVTPDVVSKIKTIPVPDQFNQIASYPIVVLKDAPQSELAKEFVAFVLAADGGQAILERWNFIPAQK